MLLMAAKGSDQKSSNVNTTYDASTITGVTLRYAVSVICYQTVLSRKMSTTAPATRRLTATTHKLHTEFGHDILYTSGRRSLFTSSRYEQQAATTPTHNLLNQAL